MSEAFIGLGVYGGVGAVVSTVDDDDGVPSPPPPPPPSPAAAAPRMRRAGIARPLILLRNADAGDVTRRAERHDVPMERGGSAARAPVWQLL
jgi:hypothetical protein